MARPKRVPYRPDTFQEKGRKVFDWVREREAGAIVVIVVLVLGFVLAVVFVTRHNTNEQSALGALYRHRGDLKRLEQALQEYGSTSARPLTLLAVAGINLRRPLDDAGEPEEETDAARQERLARAEKALRTLVDEYPKHELHLYGLTLLGAVLEEEGRYEDAVKELKAALGIAPATLEAKVRYDLGRLHVLMGDEGAARPYLLEARARSSREIDVPSPYGGRSTRQKPAWFLNAEYLLARIGTGEKRVEFPKPGAGKKPELKKPETEKKPGTVEIEKPPAVGPAGPSAAPEESAPGDAGAEAEGTEAAPGP